MKAVNIIRRSGRTLRSAKLRTLLTALAIAVGGFTLTLTLAAGNGVRDYTTQLVASNFDPAELLVGRDEEVENSGSPSETPRVFDESVTSIQGGGPGGSFQVKQITREDINELKLIEGVESVRENYNLEIRYVTRGDNQERFTGRVEAFNPAQKPDMRIGDITRKTDLADGTVLLPEAYISLLGFESENLAIGEQISVVAERPFSIEQLSEFISTSQSDSFQVETLLGGDGGEGVQPERQTFVFTIVGVTKKPATSLSFGVLPLLISRQDATQMYEFTTTGTANFDRFLFVNVRVKDGEDKQVRDAMKDLLRSKDYFVQSSEDIQKTITQFVDILQGVVAALAGITIIASVFGIINTQYISVLERTREIGLMKALGMSRRAMSSLFIFEAVWIGFIGGLLGITAGWLLGISINPWITEALDLGAGNALLIFDGLQLLMLLLGLMLIAALAGVLPARKAGKLDPVEALRTE